MTKTNKITVNDKPITIVEGADRSNYICLTDMIKAYEPDPVRTDMIIACFLPNDRVKKCQITENNCDK